MVHSNSLLLSLHSGFPLQRWFRGRQRPSLHVYSSVLHAVSDSLVISVPFWHFLSFCIVHSWLPSTRVWNEEVLIADMLGLSTTVSLQFSFSKSNSMTLVFIPTYRILPSLKLNHISKVNSLQQFYILCVLYHVNFVNERLPAKASDINSGGFLKRIVEMTTGWT